MPRAMNIAAVAALAVALGVAPTADANVIARAVTDTITPNVDLTPLDTNDNEFSSGELNVNSFTLGTPTTDVTGDGPFDTTLLRGEDLGANVNARWVEFGSPGDMFGYAAVGGGFEPGLVNGQTGLSAPEVSGLPFAVIDDSDGSFASDTGGIIVGSGPNVDFLNFFGVVDTANNDTSGLGADGVANSFDEDGTGDSLFTATWEFDITGASGGLSIAVDLGAMGDFEVFPSDQYDFEYSFDGTNYTELFRSSIRNTSIEFGGETPVDPVTLIGTADEDTVYIMEGGAVVGLNDPLTINGQSIGRGSTDVDGNKVLTTVEGLVGEAPNGATELFVRFIANQDGGSEAVVFRNLTISDGAATPLFGDFNDDGEVNAADYTLWRDGEALANEASNPGVISQDDYDDWAAAYGNTSAPAAGVPEPTAAIALALGLVAAAARRR